MVAIGAAWDGASSRANATTLDLAGQNMELPKAGFFGSQGYLNGTDDVSNSGFSNATLFEGGGPPGTIYSGVISDGGSALTAWDHTGGDVTVTGVNTQTGGTTIQGGNVTIFGSGTLGGNFNPLTVSGGVLDLGGTT